MTAQTVSAALERDLKALAKRDSDLATSALAASARVMAAELDKDRNSPTSKSMCARALIDTLDRLYDLAPAAEEKDQVDDLTAKRAARLAAG